jgi:hypothetical protein
MSPAIAASIIAAVMLVVAIVAIRDLRDETVVCPHCHVDHGDDGWPSMSDFECYCCGTRFPVVRRADGTVAAEVL